MWKCWGSGSAKKSEVLTWGKPDTPTQVSEKARSKTCYICLWVRIMQGPLWHSCLIQIYQWDGIACINLHLGKFKICNHQHIHVRATSKLVTSSQSFELHGHDVCTLQIWLTTINLKMWLLIQIRHRNYKRFIKN
jgi:hypothetical protein